MLPSHLCLPRHPIHNSTLSDLQVHIMRCLTKDVGSSHRFSFLSFPFLPFALGQFSADIMVKKALSARALLFSLVAVSVQLVNAQDDDPASTWPHAYPGMPSGDFSPEWQNCASILCSLGVGVKGTHTRSFTNRLPSDGEAHQRHLGLGTELGGNSASRPSRSSQRYSLLLGIRERRGIIH